MLQKLLETISIFLFVVLTPAFSETHTDKTKEMLAKRSLLEREREFLKNQPMSSDLRNFILKHKISKRHDGRTKRSEQINENFLYKIENGQLVPVKEVKRSDAGSKLERNKFTMMPLVNGISPKVDAIASEELKRAVQSQSVEPVKQVSIDFGRRELRNTEKIETSSIENADEPEDDNKTKEESQVLKKILEDVEGLMQWKHEGNLKEGMICNLNGSWISAAAGMRFDICYENTTRKKFRIYVADRIPPNEDGFLCDGNWTVFGELPFVHSGMIIVLAVHPKDKHIATFIGECRICENSETVTGTWLLGRSSRDCKDQKASHKILSDVWKREQAHTLRKKHLKLLGYDVKNEE